VARTNCLGAIDDGVEPYCRRDLRLNARQRRLHQIDRLDDIGAGLLEHDQQNA
jgi:hypothetical protein